MTKSEFKNLCALVLEDVPSMRELLVHLLREIGIKDVVTSEDGADGLDKVAHAPIPIDIIICDLEMPIINGIEFIQMLRRHANAAIKSTPIVVVTGHSERKNLYQAVQAGVHGFLVKPVSRKALEHGVRHALTNAPIDPGAFLQKTKKQSGRVNIIEG